MVVSVACCWVDRTVVVSAACCWVDRTVVVSVAWRRSVTEGVLTSVIDMGVWVRDRSVSRPGHLCQVSQREDGCKEIRIIK